MSIIHYPSDDHYIKHHEIPDTVTPRFIRSLDKTLFVLCKSCHTRMDKILRCSQCKKVYYCNIECQKKHWKQHKKKCLKNKK